MPTRHEAVHLTASFHRHYKQSKFCIALLLSQLISHGCNAHALGCVATARAWRQLRTGAHCARQRQSMWPHRVQGSSRHTGISQSCGRAREPQENAIIQTTGTATLTNIHAVWGRGGGAASCTKAGTRPCTPCERSEQGTGAPTRTKTHIHGDRQAGARTNQPCKNFWPNKKISFMQGPRCPVSIGKVWKYKHPSAPTLTGPFGNPPSAGRGTASKGAAAGKPGKTALARRPTPGQPCPPASKAPPLVDAPFLPRVLLPRAAALQRAPAPPASPSAPLAASAKVRKRTAACGSRAARAARRVGRQQVKELQMHRNVVPDLPAGHNRCLGEADDGVKRGANAPRNRFGSTPTCLPGVVVVNCSACC
jgi:hypothetical protein